MFTTCVKAVALVVCWSWALGHVLEQFKVENVSAMIFKQAIVVVIYQSGKDFYYFIIIIPKQFEVYNSIVRKMIHIHAIFPGVYVSGSLPQDQTT